MLEVGWGAACPILARSASEGKPPGGFPLMCRLVSGVASRNVATASWLAGSILDEAGGRFKDRKPRFATAQSGRFLRRTFVVQCLAKERVADQQPAHQRHAGEKHMKGRIDAHRNVVR